MPARNKKAAEADLPELEFPVEPEFVSRPVELDPEVILRRSEAGLARRMAAAGFHQRRLEEKVDVEFRL